MNEEKQNINTSSVACGDSFPSRGSLEEMTPEQLGGEIRLLTAQARKVVLSCAIEIGHRLKLAKEKVGHGEWMAWVERETSLSQSNVNRMMRLYEEYGKRQESLFGAELNSSTLANLSVSNALALLAFPAEEREQAAAELDAENVSSRELAEAIAARKAAEERAEQAEEKAKKWEDQAGAYASQANDLQNDLRDARKEIYNLEHRPQSVAVERDEQAIEEAAAAARGEAEAKAQEKIASLEKKLEKAEKDREKLKKRADEGAGPYEEKLKEAERAAIADREELEKLRRQLAASDKDVTEFLLHSKRVQTAFADMFGALHRVAERDMATAQKLNAGVAALLKKLGERCAGLEGKAAEPVPLPGQTEMGG